MSTTIVLLKRASLLAACLLALAPLAARAQSPERPWRAELELGGAAFFGNTSQITLTARSSAALADSVRELSLDGSVTYGEATDPAGDSFVNKRSWSLGLTYDRYPEERWSPFVLGRLESSFEQRIEVRANVGAGAKYTIASGEGRALDVSWALLGERSDPLGAAVASETLLRWSGRLRGRKSLAGERVTLQSETFWKPALDRMGDFTFTSANSIAFVLTDRVSLKASFFDRYDSGAEGRGARSNNDGQVVLTVLGAL
jgi:hypothetical protein